MATFLNNLPSFDKNNFSNFQPDLNRCQQPRRPSFYTSARDYPDEQIIVNERCNLIIQYLEKQTRNDQQNLIALCAATLEKHGRKRELNEVMKNSKNAQSNKNIVYTVNNDTATTDNESTSSAKYMKKRRLQEQFANGNPSTTSAVNNTVLLNTSQNVQDDIIDIDDDDTTTSSETANNNLNTNNNDNNSNITLNTRASISSTINDRNSTNDNKNFVSNW